MDEIRIKQMLLEKFVDDGKVGDVHILGEFTEEEIQIVALKGYIRHCSNTELGDKQYRITDKGRNLRNEY